MLSSGVLISQGVGQLISDLRFPFFCTAGGSQLRSMTASSGAYKRIEKSQNVPAHGRNFFTPGEGSDEPALARKGGSGFVFNYFRHS
jgi:hypothetical protein